VLGLAGGGGGKHEWDGNFGVETELVAGTNNVLAMEVRFDGI